MAQGGSPLAVAETAALGASQKAAAPDPALHGLVLLAQFHGVAADADQIAHEFGRTDEIFDETTLLLAAKKLGLKAKVSAQPVARVGMVSFPALALVPEGESFIVAKAIRS